MQAATGAAKQDDLLSDLFGSAPAAALSPAMPTAVSASPPDIGVAANGGAGGGGGGMSLLDQIGASPGLGAMNNGPGMGGNGFSNNPFGGMGGGGVGDLASMSSGQMGVGGGAFAPASQSNPFSGAGGGGFNFGKQGCGWEWGVFVVLLSFG